MIRFARELGCVTGEFLQFDGMAFRSEQELERFLTELKGEGIRVIDLTFYGTEAYHDRFAARKGDYRLMMDTLKASNRVGLDVSVSIPLTRENLQRVKEDLDWLVAKYDYRNADADWRNSKDALQRSMQKVAGIYPADPPYKNE